MKEYIRDGLRRLPDALSARSWVREYLQARVLGSLQEAGAMAGIAFHGGTCLRFLYSIPRYSEDLDFALEKPSTAYDFRSLVRRVERDFSDEGYTVDAQVRDAHPVHSAFIRFPGLLYELSLSVQPSEVTAIKIEVDTRPPAGAQCTTTLLRRHLLLNLFHHDRASLLAGKLHAILDRPYVKGRDLFDLFWYLADSAWPAPNIVMLANALAQTAGNAAVPDAADWRALVAARCAGLDWKEVLADVLPFIETQTSLASLTRDNLQRLLDRGA
ncbi:MAG: nucleotidyl transferase AbiEii/AbiGii toxin family protein [Spirochaetia bacterium]|jgi:hypothetical protein